MERTTPKTFAQRFIDWYTSLKEKEGSFDSRDLTRLDTLTAHDIKTLGEFFEQPIDMLIFCPNCGKQHVDKPEPDICVCGHEHNFTFGYKDKINYGRCVRG